VHITGVEVDDPIAIEKGCFHGVSSLFC
jgi:hypothetical protein